MKARKPDCRQLTTLIGQKVFAARKLDSATCGFYSYNICYVKQESALHRGEKNGFQGTKIQPVTYKYTQTEKALSDGTSYGTGIFVSSGLLVHTVQLRWNVTVIRRRNWVKER